jgi:predicted amidohydrolase YtcJ
VGYRRGELRPGADADFTVVDRNIETCTAEELMNVKVLATYCAGRRMYHADGAAHE